MASTGRITVEDQLAWVLERLPRTPEVVLPLPHAAGLVLAEDARSLHPLPLWDSSAMDGYAVRAADVAAASEADPVPLAVVGEVAAGSSADPELPPGSAVRIMTGAPVPNAADAVIPVELTRGDVEGDPWATAVVRALAAVPEGANIRRRGEDAEAGSVLGRAGSPLDARSLAALAAAGLDRVTARLKPRVAVLVTGSELRAIGEPLARGEIPESNSLLIAGLLREAGIEPTRVRRSSDDVEAFARELAELAAECDVVVTTGGLGPGSHDIVRIALEREPDVRPVRVAVRPGQLQCAGRLRGGAFVFALPGNPVSAAVGFELFVRPALLAAQGRREPHRMRVTARAATAWRGRAGSLQVLPVILSAGPDGLSCAPAVNPRGVSHAVGGHGSANGYALVGAETGDVAAGDAVEVIPVAL